MSQFMKGIKSFVACGKRTSWSDAKKMFQAGCHIVVGTIGKVNSFMEVSKLGDSEDRPEILVNGNDLRLLVIDEADKLLTDYSSKSDVQKVVKKYYIRIDII